MKTLDKIQYMTSKGQITLPVAWRKEVGGMAVCVRTVGKRIEIIPVRTEEDESGWVSIFKANEKKPDVDEVLAFLRKNHRSKNKK